MNPAGDGPWQLGERPCAEHEHWAAAGGHVLASADWAAVVATLGAEPRFAWHPGRGIGVLLPLFRRHGLRVGFLGFPVSGPPWDGAGAGPLLADARALARLAGVPVVRATQRQPAPLAPGAVSARIEQVIPALAHWDPAASRVLRRDLAFAARACSGLSVQAQGHDAEACARLYAETVQRHRGALRYGPDYFRALAEAAGRQPRLHVLSARGPDGATEGFAAVALHGPQAYYLHGAVSLAARRQGLSDLLLSRLVALARDAGCERFSLMSSPWAQPGLHRFKAKWGPEAQLAQTHDAWVGARGLAVALALRFQARAERRAARDYGVGG